MQPFPRLNPSFHDMYVSFVGTYMSWNEGFSGGNGCINVLDCGAHRSDNLTPYASPAKLRPLAFALRYAAQRRRKYGARHGTPGARRAHWRNGVQHLFLESPDVVARTQSAGGRTLRSDKDSWCRGGYRQA